MKKTVILPESLLERAFPALLTVITNGKQNNNHFILFKYIKEIARITNTTNNLNKVIDLLNKTETSYEYVEEANIDEYFFSHTDEPELYLTPTDSSSQVISSAALLKFKGTLLIYDLNKDAPTPRNCNSYINVFSLNQHAGGKSLNKSSAEHHHITGSCCTFTIDGKTYKETIKGRSKSAHQGVEGFTQTSECNPNYKLKIWDSPNKKQFEIDKLRNMIALKNKHPEIAFPLAFVYNDQNNIIGFVMKNFSGTNTSFADIHKLKNPAIYVKQLLEQLIFLEVNGFLHRDVHHNILIDTKKQTLNIIDIDSIQFKAYPATALSFDRENAAPEIYQSDSLFFNTIEISYSAMCALIAVFTEPKSIFGLYDDKGFVEVDSKALSEIKNVAPQIENLVRVSHRTGKPVALVRQLHELCALTANNTPNTIVVGETTLPTTKPAQKDRVTVTPSTVTSCDKHYPKETPNYFKKFKLWAMEKIIDQYMPGTVIEGQSIEELFKIFIKTGLWKKPLAGTSLTILTIVVLLITIIQLY